MKFLTAFFVLFLATPVLAQSKFSLRFEPLYGVEHAYHRYPDPPSYSTRTFFGLRVLAGVTLLSLELEGNQSNGRREFPSRNLKTEDQIQRVYAGLRSTVPTTNWMAFFFRAGGRGTKERTTITDTTDNSKTTKEPPLQWDPYAGTGIQIALSNVLATSAGATWAFPQGRKADVQYTLGVTLKFGQVK